MSLVTTIILSILGSSTLSILVTKWFDRRQSAATVELTGAEAGKVRAETADIIAEASEKAINTMAEQLATAYEHIGKLQNQVERLMASLDNAFLRIRFLEDRLEKYERVKPYVHPEEPPTNTEGTTDAQSAD